MDLEALGEFCKILEMMHNAGHLMTSICPYETQTPLKYNMHILHLNDVYDTDIDLQ
jgi:hypothetical protein